VSQVSSTEVAGSGRGHESDSDPGEEQVIIELDDYDEQELDDGIIVTTHEIMSQCV